MALQSPSSETAAPALSSAKSTAPSGRSPLGRPRRTRCAQLRAPRTARAPGVWVLHRREGTPAMGGMPRLATAFARARRHRGSISAAGSRAGARCVRGTRPPGLGSGTQKNSRSGSRGSDPALPNCKLPHISSEGSRRQRPTPFFGGARRESAPRGRERAGRFGDSMCR